MNGIEKIGLLIVLVFFTSAFPASWKGAEVVIMFVGGLLFLGGKYIAEWIDALRSV